ncbi:hypothetical protein M3Y96_00189700 [Aphelenchoides besseyi]|nr:hypothetical protein M3Y96_00189700 [Aphelenchoides besseyi]
MGLYFYFFHPDEYNRMYNCSFYSVEDLPIERRRHVIYAIIVLALFVIYEVKQLKSTWPKILYLPCIYAMFNKHVRQSFCYKLMIEMALYDMITLPLTALLPGIFSFNGWMFCSHPTITYMGGTIIFPMWIGYSLCSLILSINRCLSMSRYKVIFEGPTREMFWVLLPPFVTFVVLMFGQSITYNSMLGAWFFNPHLGYYEDLNGSYPSDIQFYNNITFCVVLPVVYVLFFLNNYALSRKRVSGMSGKEYRLFIQTLIINFTIAGAAAGYMLMQYLSLPEYFIAFSHVGWIIVEGAPPVIYLTMNETIRKIVFGRKRTHTQQRSSSVQNINSSTVPHSKINDSSVVH